MAAAAAGILVMPEPGTRRAGVVASLRPRVGVPRQARVMFLVATPCLIAAFGVGFGVAFLGAFRVVSGLAPPSERAGLVAAIWIVNFLAFSIPALIAGWAVTRFGLHRTALVYSGVVAALAAAAAGSLIVGRLARRTSTTARTTGQ
jgi:hypothetical protein